MCAMLSVACRIAVFRNVACWMCRATRGAAPHMCRFIVNHDELEHALRTRSDADPSFVFSTLNFDALTLADQL